jgi:hypothetical protein
MREFLISQRVCRDQLAQRVSKQKRVLSVIDSKAELVQVGRQLFRGMLLVAALDRPLEQGPSRLDVLRRYLAPNPFFLAAVNALMPPVLVPRCGRTANSDRCRSRSLHPLLPLLCDEPCRSTRSQTCPPRSTVPRTMVLFRWPSWCPRPLRFPPMKVSSALTTPLNWRGSVSSMPSGYGERGTKRSYRSGCRASA